MRPAAGRRQLDSRDLVVAEGVRHVVVPADDVNRSMEKVASARVPYSVGRDMLRHQLVARVVERYEDQVGSFTDRDEFAQRVRRSKSLKQALDRRWPIVAPATLVTELLAKPATLAAAAEGILSPTEQRVLRRRRAGSWTSADAALVDEARHLLAGQTRTYAHAIIDEAQDLSPMQLRMLARRCPSGSMTLLGDLAQAVGVWGLSDWQAVTEWLPTPHGLEVVELRYGYRSPAQEPAAIVAERTHRPAGLRLLYVALTRPTQHVSVLATSSFRNWPTVPDADDADAVPDADHGIFKRWVETPLQLLITMIIRTRDLVAHPPSPGTRRWAPGTG